jgi:hypothetical protein
VQDFGDVPAFNEDGHAANVRSRCVRRDGSVAVNRRDARYYPPLIVASRVLYRPPLRVSLLSQKDC